MARQARLNVVGGVFHLVSRFARDEPWLERPGARDVYLEMLGRAAATGGVEVLAYCLMPDHVQLVVVQGERPLQRFAKSLHTGFAAWVHRVARGRKATGPVFADRPTTVLVDPDSQLLELVRYVHNAPVRAGVARVARSSGWSSHQAYIGRVKAPAWLRAETVLRRLGKSTVRAMKQFDPFVDEGRTEARPAAFVPRAPRLVAKPKRAKPTPSRRPSLRAVIDAVLAFKGVERRQLVEHPKVRTSSAVKRLVVWVWLQQYAGTQTELVHGLKLDSSMISRYYGQALQNPGDYERDAAKVAASLATHKSARR